MKQRISSRECIVFCSNCGDMTILADGCHKLCKFCNPKKKTPYHTVLFKNLKKKILEKYDHICQYCFKKTADCVDHIIPLYRGGTTEIENLIASCKSCNSRKFFKTIQEFKQNKKSSYIKNRLVGQCSQRQKPQTVIF